MIMCLIYVNVGGFRELLVWIGWESFFVWGGSCYSATYFWRNGSYFIYSHWTCNFKETGFSDWGFLEVLWALS